MMKHLLLTILFICNFSFAISPDYEKEKRWATQVEDGLMDGDIVEIKSNNKPFMAIFTEAEEESKKAVIILHGLGAHPDWADVISPLRISLTTIKYNTLSIQLPVLANEIDSSEYKKLFIDASSRIKASINFLEKQGFIVEILIAHSMGTSMAAHFLANNPHNITKFIGIGMNPDSLEYLPKIKISILDLYGDDDLKIVMNSVNKRKIASKQNSLYQQKVIKGNHFFNGTGGTDRLISVVHNWLK